MQSQAAAVLPSKEAQGGIVHNKSCSGQCCSLCTCRACLSCVGSIPRCIRKRRYRRRQGQVSSTSAHVAWPPCSCLDACMMWRLSSHVLLSECNICAQCVMHGSCIGEDGPPVSALDFAAWRVTRPRSVAAAVYWPVRMGRTAIRHFCCAREGRRFVCVVRTAWLHVGWVKREVKLDRTVEPWGTCVYWQSGVVDRYTRWQGGAGMQARLVVLLVADGGILLGLLDAQQDLTYTQSNIRQKHKLPGWLSSVSSSKKGCVQQLDTECSSILCTVFLPVLFKANAAEHPTPFPALLRSVAVEPQPFAIPAPS